MYNILVVDDREVFCRSIIRMPFFQEHEDKFRITHSARNGIEALQYLKSSAVDVTLTDIRMPLMGGIELLKAIQKNHLCRCTILLSEYAEFSYAKEGIINGAFDYLVKPIDNEKIQDTFSRVFEYLQQENKSERTCLDEIDKLAECVIRGSRAELEFAIHEVTDCILQNEDLKKAAAAMVEMTLHKIQAGINVDFPYAALYLPIKRLCALPPWIAGPDDCILVLTQIAAFLHQELKKFQLDSRHPLVQNVWYYTLSHIEESCKLQNVAERFYVNKNYLSTLFKKETGIYYKDFVSEFKIERAKILLTYSNLKIYNIAENLHFNDPEYFSKIFKLQVGLSPSEFSYQTYIEAQIKAQK